MGGLWVIPHVICLLEKSPQIEILGGHDEIYEKNETQQIPI